jgi:hypothetical protein
MASQISWGGVAVRVVGALLLVYATYNPEGVSFYHWLAQPKPGETGAAGLLHGFTPFKAFVGLALLAAWVVFVQAARRSLGTGGALLIIALFGVSIWALIYYGAISPTSSRAIAHLVLIAISLVLGIGMSWSLISRRMTGQVDTDTVG